LGIGSYDLIRHCEIQQKIPNYLFGMFPNVFVYQRVKRIVLAQ